MDNPHDPSGFIRNPPSVIVKIQNTTQVNGKFGLVVYYSLDRGRYVVQMTESQQSVFFKPEALVRASMMERVRARYQHLRQQYDRLATLLIPGGIRPENVAITLGFFLLISVFIWGWTPVLWFLFPVILLTCIMFPDLVGQENLPGWYFLLSMRCRQWIEQRIRGLTSDEVAGIFVAAILVYVVIKKFVTPDSAQQSNNKYEYLYLPWDSGTDFGMNQLPLIQY